MQSDIKQKLAEASGSKLSRRSKKQEARSHKPRPEGNSLTSII